MQPPAAFAYVYRYLAAIPRERKDANEHHPGVIGGTRPIRHAIAPNLEIAARAGIGGGGKRHIAELGFNGIKVAIIVLAGRRRAFCKFWRAPVFVDQAGNRARLRARGVRMRLGVCGMKGRIAGLQRQAILAAQQWPAAPSIEVCALAAIG